MLDTIILQIEIGKYYITDYAKFRTTKERMLNTTAPFFKWVNNPTKEDKEKGIYKPRLTIIKRGRKLYLKIEFSAPKLLFGNNLDELEENDFDKIAEKLQKRMLEMGVRIFLEQIKKAEVLSFHPSKNIPLSKGYTVSFAIRELFKINLDKRFDLEKVSFRNGGESLQFYTNSHSFVIYDKMNDFKKPKRRAIDKDQTIQQLSLFDYVKKEKKRLEVLRFEIRLSKKKKMNEIFKKVGYLENPTFEDIFRKDLCQKIVKLYWNDFFENNLFLFSVNNNPQKILQLTLIKYPDIKIIKAIKMVGLYVLCKDGEGMRGFRQIIDNYKPNINWTVVKRDLKLFEDEIFTNSIWGFLEDIKRELKEFVPLKLNK